jgi:succinoglycan biosynthesis transport protein ExoP
LTDLFNLRSNLDMLYSKQNNLELALADLRNKIDLVPEYQARLDQLNREVTAATEIRDRLKQQQESAQISQAILQESEFKVVQPARLPLEPVSPDKKKLLIMGIVLGLVLGGGLAFLMELLDNSFRNVDDVEEQLNLPVLGVIPEIKVVKKAHLNK